MHLISDFVIELLETLDIPASQINELLAKLEIVGTLDQPEQLMVHLCKVAQNIIQDGQAMEDETIIEQLKNPTKDQVRVHAARMTLCYLALLNCDSE